jgi:CRISPR-associated endonuclease Csn1
MPRTLGLDIGSNSVGWALVDESAHTIVAMGVRVFPEGVDRDKQGGELSKNVNRRQARALRRQIARRARRRRLLRRSLVDCGLYPADRAKQAQLDALDPYALRARALAEPLTPSELGRVFLHLAQRRGFLSNRKADRQRKKENEGILKEINDLAAALDGRTLGQHFAASLQADRHEPVRGHHTHRQMFLDEFERIWAAQQPHHPDLLTDSLKYGRRGLLAYPRKPDPLPHRKTNSPLAEYGLHGLIFFQRALYWPRSIVGRCSLEPKQPRCERADRLAQRFRVLQEVNNLRVTTERGQERPLADDERSKVLDLLSRKKEVKFDDIRKQLALSDHAAFNLERADRKKLDGLTTDALLSGKNYFGPKAWTAFPEPTKDAIVRSLLDDDEPTILRKAREDWGVTDDGLARRLADLDLGDGRAAFSRAAIEKLLPHLERGLRLMANDATDSALHAAGYLRPDQRVIDQRDTLPPPPDDITNPLVKQALFEVRKVVNAILREYGKPDAIHVELARAVIGGSKKREAYIKRLRDRERQREDAADLIRAHGQKPTHDSIERVLLWQDQRETCLYSGRPISVHQLFGAEVQVDHLLPFSRSLDNSYANKVLCFRDENVAKANRTVAEWLQDADSDRYDAILQRAWRLPEDSRQGKLKKIAARDVVLDDFLDRQLADTAYISRQVLAYVRRLGADVVATRGQSTAELRHLWGLNTVLRDDGLNLKSRDDHRHHAVDALVVALTNRSRLQQLARLRFLRDELPHLAPRPGAAERAFPPPWDAFRDQAQALVDAILVSHRPVRRLSGALHEETLYGRTAQPERASASPRPHARDWIEDENVYVVRKPLESLTLPEVHKIRDPRTRELVLDRLRQRHVDPDGSGKIPPHVWQPPLRMIGKRGADKSPNAPVIKSVRVTKPDKTIRPIRSGDRTAHVKPGNTHHICLFELPGHTPERPRRDMVAVTMLEAADRARRGEPLIRRAHPTVPEARFLFSLSRGETVHANIRGREDYYVFRTAASTQGQIYFYSQTDARPGDSARKFAVNANTLNGRKVLIDPLGRLRDAHD